MKKLGVVIIIFAFIVSISLSVWVYLYAVPSFQLDYFRAHLADGVVEEDGLKELTSDALLAETKSLEQKLDQLNPVKAYIIINTTSNTYELYRDKRLIRKGICSTGSQTELEGANKRKWVFETPKGVFKVRNKIVDPVWKKPDWAFAEEGLPIPSANHESRYEYGVLGDYALSLGDGYLIHGTLFQRFLGLPVTHGCIRLADDDLEAVYKELPIGAKVYIY